MRLWGISARIYAIVALASFSLLVLSETLLHFAVGNAYEMRQQHLSDVTDTAVSILAELQKQVEAGEMDLAAAKAEGAKRISGLRFDDSGYFFVIDHSATVQAHPVKPDWVGTSKIDLTDPQGTKIYQEMIALAESEGAGSIR